MAEGQRWLADLRNVSLRAGDLRDELQRLDENSIDCIISCYALAYISPAELDEVLRLAWRAARKAVILMEPQVIGREVPSTSQLIEWAHDYRQAMQKLGAAPEIVLLPPDIRQGALTAVMIAPKPPTPRP